MGLLKWVTKGRQKKRAIRSGFSEPHAPCFEQLEPRVLLNADGFMPLESPLLESPNEVAIVVELVETEADQSQCDSGTVEPCDSKTLVLSDSQSTGLSVSELGTVAQHIAAQVNENETAEASASEDLNLHRSNFTLQTSDLDASQIRGPPTEIVFIDSSLNLDLQLKNACPSGVVVSVLDHNQDGILQITSLLSAHSNLDAIHIISHGAPGQVVLGNEILDTATLDSHSEVLSAWQHALTPGGDILLYGCSVGEGRTGTEFMRQLAAMTGGDVAASSNPTGNVGLGGDWVLELTTGPIEAAIPFGQEMLSGLDGLLDDFGDAPGPYPTTWAQQGAQHTASGPTLGANRDSESDGVPSVAADADDTTGTPDDEDGVAFDTIRVGQVDCSVTVNVQGGSAKLDAWIDFNGDGSWGGAQEQIFASRSVVVGDNALTFDVPSWAITGDTYARFRLSTAGDLGPAGPAADGEVEDYLVTILHDSGSGVFLDSGNSLGSSQSLDVSLGDLDGDGDLDAFVANGGQANKVWLNNGSGIFLDSGNSLGSSYSYDVSLGDVDGDGDLDAFVANYDQANTVWLNNGLGFFTDSGNSLGSSSSVGVFLGDVDGDGDLDAFVANYDEANKVWLNNGLGFFIDSGNSLGSSLSVGASLGDVDGDGDLDAFVANDFGANKVWLNNGSGSFTDSGNSLGSFWSWGVSLGDVDGDGDLDAFVANLEDVNEVWLNNGSGSFTDSGDSLGNSSSVGVSLGDVDGDGDLDAFVANDGEVNKVWLNNGSGSFTGGWNSPGSSSSNGVFLGDVDGDGDLDAFVANFGQANKVWLNQAKTATNVFPVDGSAGVPQDVVVLSWNPGAFAAEHDVFVGVDYNTVNSATRNDPAYVTTQSETTLALSSLAFGQTYYWRIDEINESEPGSPWKGDVWSFTVQPYSILIPGSSIAVTASSYANEFSMPEKTIDGSGLGVGDIHGTFPETMWFTVSADDDPWIQYEFNAVKQLDTMRVWNSNSSAESFIGWGVKDVLIEYSVDGLNWNVLAGATQFSPAPGLPSYDSPDEIAFGGLSAKYVRFDILSNWGGLLTAYSLSEVQFTAFDTAPVNDPPTDINLSDSSVLGNQVVGTAVGTLTTTDPNAGDTHTYSLVAGSGSDDNGSFTITGDQLLTNAVFDYETKNSYSIRVQTDDGHGGTYQESFIINITTNNSFADRIDLGSASSVTDAGGNIGYTGETGEPAQSEAINSA